MYNLTQCNPKEYRRAVFRRPRLLDLIHSETGRRLLNKNTLNSKNDNKTKTDNDDNTNNTTYKHKQSYE